VPAGTRVLPPKPNERVVSIKTNRSGEISSVRYTTEEERPYFEGIRAAKVPFIPPKEAPKHVLNSFETPPKRRKTIADLDKEVRRTDKLMMELQSSVNFFNRQISNLNTTVLNLRRDLSRATDRIKELERR
jgi:septal ring factor EnvC (AmiA/AmiB activator)